MGKFNDDTNFIFADPSFLAGFASVIDLGGALIEYNFSRSPQEADTRAIASDWVIIGKDIKSAVTEFEQKKEK
ncbi:MAG TPA: hypothetical protein VNQ79_16080 [Blastocatellia bacterium]|nr:hypothetical protein [Blastocatellia bacterium]